MRAVSNASPISSLAAIGRLYLLNSQFSSISIPMAAETKADFVLIDEREGRRLAVQAGLSVTGVLGILLRAKLKGENKLA